MSKTASMLGFAIVLASCSSKQAEPPPPIAPPVMIADAGADAITTISDFDPASGMHLDEDHPNGRTPAGRRAQRNATPIGIILKSTPPGSTVYVDGITFGTTPQYWNGMADGSEHDFAFTSPGYALARYRFVPVSNGTLHATLERIGDDVPSDGGLDPMLAPRLAPDAAIAPPPTVLSPPDARVVAPVAVDAGADAVATPVSVDASPRAVPVDANRAPATHAPADAARGPVDPTGPPP